MRNDIACTLQSELHLNLAQHPAMSLNHLNLSLEANLEANLDMRDSILPGSKDIEAIG